MRRAKDLQEVKLIDGKVLAEKIKNKLTVDREVSFAAVLVGDNPSSLIYVNTKKRECEKLGIKFQLHKFDAKVSQVELENYITKLSADKNIHAILVQLPLPDGLDSNSVIEKISPYKDVDALTYANFGRLAKENGILVPCTALGILHAIKSVKPDLTGQHAVIVGRSNIVGKPTALLLTAENATVTLCHSKTENLSLHTKAADILISAAGKSNLITADMVKPGAIVIDVGINRLDNGKLTGDVDFAAVSRIASAITPVPGGIGPLTIAFLLKNIIDACKLPRI
jgi:methylenetetrahydrofolate dehydrogenase (NADP+)/methenyltetrahydrofolate cyclohydrolase